MDRSLYFEIHRQFNIERQRLPADLRVVFDELSVMALLQLNVFMSVKEISQAQLVCSSTVSRRIAHLERGGFVSTFHLPGDKRLNYCALTPFGDRVVRAFYRAFLDNFVPGSTLDLMGLTTADIAALVSRMGRVPMPADNLILFCYVMRGSEAMKVRDMVNLTGMLQATVSMTLRRMESDGSMEPVRPGHLGSVRPHARLGLRYITRYGQRCGAELLRLVDEV